MADETQLNISITANEAASAQIRALQSSIQTLEKTIKAFGAESANTSTVIAASIMKEVGAIGQNIALRKQQIAVLREEIAARTEAAIAAQREGEARIEAALGPDRAILSAAASARTLETSLSAAAEADSRLRDAAIEASAALVKQRDFQVELMKAEDAWAAAAIRDEKAVAEAQRLRTIEQMNAEDMWAAAAARDEAAITEATNARTATQLRAESMMERGMAGRAFADVESVGAGGGVAGEAIGARSGILQREARHVVAIFDGLARHQVGQVISSIGAAARDAGFGIAALGTSMGGLIAVMGTTAILHAAENMGAMAEKTRANAAAAGMAVSDFSALQGAMGLIGIKADSADVALRHLAVALSTALAQPAGNIADAFHALGISQEQLVANGNNVTGALNLLANAFVRTADGANKSAAFNQILGRSYEELVPALQQGSDGLDQLKTRAKELGIVLTDDMINQLVASGQAVRDLGDKITGGGIQSMVAWAPEIKALAEALSTLVDVLGQVSTGIASVTNGIVGALSWTEKFTLNVATGQIGSAEAQVGRLFGFGGPDASAAPTAAQSLRTVPGQHSQKASVDALEHITSLEDMRSAMGSAAEVATRGASSPQQLRIAQTQAEIDVMKKTLAEADLSAKDRETIETELNQKLIQLRSEKLSANIAAGHAEARAAHQSYEDFAAAEKLKITSAQGSIGQIIAIYNEWLNAANNIYHQHASEVLKIEREKVQAINTARLGELKTEVQDDEKTARLASLNAQLQAMGSGGYKFQGQKDVTAEDDIKRAQAYIAEAAQVQAVAQRQIAQFTEVAQTADAGSTTQKEAQAAVMDILLQSKQQEIELYKKAGDAAVAAANKVNEAYTKFFDSLGSQFEQFGTNIANSLIAPQTTIIHAGLTSIKIQENTVKTAFKQLFVGVAQDLAKILQESLGHAIAKAISGGASNTISEVLSKAMSKIFSSAASDAAGKALGSAASGAAGAASGAAGTTAITTAITASTTTLTTALTTSAATQVSATTAMSAAVVGAIGAAATSEDALLAALNVKPSVLGTTYAGGGIVSAAGGMVVGGIGGTQLAILHDREMVLPRHISEGIQGAISGGNFSRNNSANLNYSPTLNIARGRSGSGMTRSELSKMMGLHSGAMLGEARNLIRSGWRP